MTLKIPKPLFLSSLGGLLEFYDFIIFALFASYLSYHFFPAENQVISLLETFVAFSIGYLVRPIGGLLFGHFGDKYGRKRSFLISIGIMACSTLTIGLLPTYQQIGVLAPILLLICRTLQGLSVGGEIPGAITYISETYPEQKTFSTGIVFFFLINGIVLGGLIHSFLLSTLGQEAVSDWGWRVPFILGGFFGLFSYFLRCNFEETPSFISMQKTLHKVPLLEVFKAHKQAVLIGIALVALGASLITLLFLFIPSYLDKIIGITAKDHSWQMTLGMFLTACVTGGFGCFADHLNRKKALLIISLISLALAYPIFSLYADYHLIFPALMLSVIPLGLIWSIIPAVLSELFPTSIRYTAIGVSYNVGFALFGGLTPAIAYALIDLTGQVKSPSYYLIATSLIALLACFYITSVKQKAD